MHTLGSLGWCAVWYTIRKRNRRLFSLLEGINRSNVRLGLLAVAVRDLACRFRFFSSRLLASLDWLG